jgi:hypothetical protein
MGILKINDVPISNYRYRQILYIYVLYFSYKWDTNFKDIPSNQFSNLNTNLKKISFREDFTILLTNVSLSS